MSDGLPAPPVAEGCSCGTTERRTVVTRRTYDSRLVFVDRPVGGATAWALGCHLATTIRCSWCERSPSPGSSPAYARTRSFASRSGVCAGSKASRSRPSPRTSRRSVSSTFLRTRPGPPSRSVGDVVRWRRLGRCRVPPLRSQRHATRPAARSTRNALSVIMWFGPARPQSTISRARLLPGGCHQ